MSPLVFINYRMVDSRYGAAAIYELLRRRFGAGRVFRDCVSIGPGDVYPAVIARELERASVLLVLIGPEWLARDATGQRLIEREHDWVRREISRTLQRGIAVIPVLLDGTPMPSPAALPADIRELASRQAVQVRHAALGPDVARLAAGLVASVPGLRLSRLRRVAGAVAAALAVTASVYFGLQNHGAGGDTEAGRTNPTRIASAGSPHATGSPADDGSASPKEIDMPCAAGSWVSARLQNRQARGYLDMDKVAVTAEARPVRMTNIDSGIDHCLVMIGDQECLDSILDAARIQPCHESYPDEWWHPQPHRVGGETWYQLVEPLTGRYCLAADARGALVMQECAGDEREQWRLAQPAP